MIKRVELSASQHQGLDMLLDERAKQSDREKRFLKDCLLELGGRLNEPWQFDEATKTFWIQIPDDINARTDKGPLHAMAQGTPESAN